MLHQSLIKYLPGDRKTGQLKKDQVRLHRLDADPLDFGQAPGQKLGVGVVFGQTLDVVFQGVNSSGGDDARLAHGPAELGLPAPGLADEVF